MIHLVLFSYLIAFLFLFGSMLMGEKGFHRSAPPIARAMAVFRSALALNLLVNFIYRYIGINLEEIRSQFGLIPYMLIMASHFILLFSIQNILITVIGGSRRRLLFLAIVLICSSLFLYDQFYPRHDRVIHPYYSPVDYVFYLSLTAAVIAYAVKSKRKLFFMALIPIPFLMMDQLEMAFPVIHLEPIAGILIGVMVILERRFGSSTMTQTNESSLDKLGLSERERAVVDCLLEGLDNQSIAERLFISVATVKTHLYRIYKKTGVSSRLELVQLIRGRSNYRSQ